MFTYLLGIEQDARERAGMHLPSSSTLITSYDLLAEGALKTCYIASQTMSIHARVMVLQNWYAAITDDCI